MKELDLSVVIPTYNMAEYLPKIWDSLVHAKVVEIAREVVVVNDASNDHTLSVLERIQKTTPAGQKLKILTLEKNRSRFWARYLGAQAAQGQKLLFLDTRLEVYTNFGEVLSELASQYESLMPHVDLDVNRSVFCLYWDRSHRFLFRKHFRAIEKPFLLTFENYDAHLKGTTGFYCTRELFLKACRLYENTPLLSDDTFLMKEMVKTEPIGIHPNLRIWWYPREDSYGFLKRLWDRGPQLTEYHFFHRRGKLFYVVALGSLALLAWMGYFLVHPGFALRVAFAIFGLIALSAGFMSRSLSEFFKLAPLHLGVVLAYGLGSFRGIFVNLGRMIRGEFPWRKVSS